MKMSFNPNIPTVLFARLQGPNCIREFRAIIDTGSDLCILPVQEAYDLGYDALVDYSADHQTENVRLSNNCYFEAPSIVMEKVMIGDIEAKDVEFVIQTTPRDSSIDVILGRNFLKNFKLTLDYKQGILELE